MIIATILFVILLLAVLELVPAWRGRITGHGNMRLAKQSAPLVRKYCDAGATLLNRIFRFIFVTSAPGQIYLLALERPYRLAVRTPPFHGGGTGSIPVRVATPNANWIAEWLGTLKL